MRRPIVRAAPLGVRFRAPGTVETFALLSLFSFGQDSPARLSDHPDATSLFNRASEKCQIWR